MLIFQVPKVKLAHKPYLTIGANGKAKTPYRVIGADILDISTVKLTQVLSKLYVNIQVPTVKLMLIFEVPSHSKACTL